MQGIFKEIKFIINEGKVQILTHASKFFSSQNLRMTLCKRQKLRILRIELNTGMRKGLRAYKLEASQLFYRIDTLLLCFTDQILLLF